MKSRAITGKKKKGTEQHPGGVHIFQFYDHVAADTISGFFCVFTNNAQLWGLFLAKEKTAIPPGSSKKMFGSSNDLQKGTTNTTVDKLGIFSKTDMIED